MTTRAKPAPTCVVCGQPAQPWERTANGLYLHTGCSTASDAAVTHLASAGGRKDAA